MMHVAFVPKLIKLSCRKLLSHTSFMTITATWLESV